MQVVRSEAGALNTHPRAAGVPLAAIVVSGVAAVGAGLAVKGTGSTGLLDPGLVLVAAGFGLLAGSELPIRILPRFLVGEVPVYVGLAVATAIGACTSPVILPAVGAPLLLLARHRLHLLLLGAPFPRDEMGAMSPWRWLATLLTAVAIAWVSIWGLTFWLRSKSMFLAAIFPLRIEQSHALLVLACMWTAVVNAIFEEFCGGGCLWIGWLG